MNKTVSTKFRYTVIFSLLRVFLWVSLHMNRIQPITCIMQLCFKSSWNVGNNVCRLKNHFLISPWRDITCKHVTYYILYVYTEHCSIRSNTVNIYNIKGTVYQTLYWRGLVDTCALLPALTIENLSSIHYCVHTGLLDGKLFII